MRALTPLLDRRLAAGEEPSSSVGLTLRARRLIAPRERRVLARSLRTFVARSPSRHVEGARGELLDLADRLDRFGPVDVQGVAKVRVLLTDGGGPLYYNHGAPRLVAAAREAGAALIID
jgi:hypothetical protein